MNEQELKGITYFYNIAWKKLVQNLWEKTKKEKSKWINKSTKRKKIGRKKYDKIRVYEDW
jgi:hypothetical protein